MSTTEHAEAMRAANNALDRPFADPDDDLAILARQFLRLNESTTKLTRQRDELLRAVRYAAGSLAQVPDGVQIPPIVTMDVRDHLDRAAKAIETT